MLDGFFELISGSLNFFFTNVPGGYAVAIALLTCVIMIITTPLTLKGTRSMIEMQRLQPEIRRLQVQYKDDRQKLNEELMRFYREHEINPLGGCLPLLIQAPVFSILFWVIRGLTERAKFVGVQVYTGPDHLDLTMNVTDGFRPKYLDNTSELYQSLVGSTEMNTLGVDLARSASEVLGDNFVTALPYLAVVGAIAFLSWFQQKQIMGRTTATEMTQQQRTMMIVGPLLFVFFTFVTPLALGVYFVTSTIWRVGQQAFITRSLYRGEDSIGAQAQKAMAELRASRKAETDGAKPTRPAGKKVTESTRGNGRGQPQRAKQGQKATARSGAASSGKAAGGTGAARKPHPRSRKKRKRK